MFVTLSSARARALCAAALAAALAACASGGPPASAPVSARDFGTAPGEAPPLGAPGESAGVAAIPRVERVSRPGLTPPYLVGRPITRIGLMLPFTARPADADGLSNAAELALFDQGYEELLMMPREEGADARMAGSEAESLLRDGADIIIGPLFSQPVSGAARVAREAGVPMIAFSTDTRLVGQGAYLLNFSVEQEVDRVARYALQNGVRSFALLAPSDDYGRRVELALQAAAATGGARIAVSRFYPRNDVEAANAARALAGQLRTAPVQAIMIADGGSRLRLAATGLQAAGVDLRRIKLLGTGEWVGSTEILREPSLLGGWYPAPDPELRASFEQRYLQAYGRPPTRLAGLAYDAVALAAVLTRGTGYAGLSPEAFQRPEGFLGVDGPFRFRADGAIERSLAVMEVRQGAPQIADPAPRALAPAAPAVN